MSPAPPVRGPAARELGLALPAPGRSPLAARVRPLHAGRPLKRWRYLAAFGSELMLCAGDVRIGGVPQRFWALAERGAALLERTTTLSRGLAIAPTEGPDGAIKLSLVADEVTLDLTFAGDSAGPEPVEVVSPSGRAWAWTRKRAGVPVTGTVAIRGRRRPVKLEGVVDDSLGYHERHTAWCWSTGVGRAVSGERVAWNLVEGVHDAAGASERTVWVEGRAAEVGSAGFADDLSGIELEGGAGLRFTPWATREHRLDLVLVRSSYRQPFGTFSGELPGGLELAEGYGVMEDHDVRW